MASSSQNSKTPLGKLRWYQPSPGRLLFLLLPVEAILILLNWLQGTSKGWAVLLAIAILAIAMLSLLVWFLLAVSCRQRFQFSIRSLLVLTVAVAIPCSWLAVEMKRAKDQRAAIEAILELKGQVLLGDLRFGKDMELMVRDTAPRGPAWLVALLGPDFFEDIVSVDFTNLPIADASLESVTGLAQLRHLSLYNTNVTDVGLQHLNGLTQLHKLELVNTRITDSGLVNLKGLTRLQYLLLNDTQVTDAGLAHLEGLTQLDTLMLDNTEVTDVGLQHLKGLAKLQYLLLNGTKVTDAGVAELQKALPNCKIIR
jgi:hypothetical protein